MTRHQQPRPLPINWSISVLKYYPCFRFKVQVNSGRLSYTFKHTLASTYFPILCYNYRDVFQSILNGPLMLLQCTWITYEEMNWQDWRSRQAHVTAPSGNSELVQHSMRSKWPPSRYAITLTAGRVRSAVWRCPLKGGSVKTCGQWDANRSIC